MYIYICIFGIYSNCIFLQIGFFIIYHLTLDNQQVVCFSIVLDAMKKVLFIILTLLFVLYIQILFKGVISSKTSSLSIINWEYNIDK